MTNLYKAVRLFYLVCFILGCRPTPGDTPSPSACHSCKYARIDGECVLECPSDTVPNREKQCIGKYLNFFVCTGIAMFMFVVFCSFNT